MSSFRVEIETSGSVSSGEDTFGSSFEGGSLQHYGARDREQSVDGNHTAVARLAHTQESPGTCVPQYGIGCDEEAMNESSEGGGPSSGSSFTSMGSASGTPDGDVGIPALPVVVEPASPLASPAAEPLDGTGTTLPETEGVSPHVPSTSTLAFAGLTMISGRPIIFGFRQD